MKKAYVKPELDMACFEVADVIAASGDSHDVLDTVSDGFEKITDGILDFLNSLGG